MNICMLNGNGMLQNSINNTKLSALLASSLLAIAVLGGCSSSGGLNRAPVEDRGTPSATAPGASTGPGTGVAQPATPPKPLPGAENAGKPGYYTVRPGDTLIRIGLDTGQNWRDLVRWNNMDNPNIIEVGQVMRVIPPGTADVPAGTSVATPRPVAPPSSVTPTALPPQGTRTAAAPGAASSAPQPATSAAAPSVTPSAPAATPSTTPSTTPATAAAPLPPASSPSDDDIAWIWPTAGSVIAGFDEVKNKGIGIAGKLGDPILASGDGRVVYAGAGLRGYGNLVILKHNNTFLTAYAHNQTLLVKEDQTVRKGQKIAEMGQSDSDRVKLHFEIRKQGKPVDPTRYLPAR